MASILSGLRKLCKLRKHERYAVMDGTFVIIVPGKEGEGQELKVQLIDISQGGMAFIYHGSPSELETSGILKLIEQREVDFDTVSDIPLNVSAQPSEPFRRRGVKFNWMGPFERAELSSLIREVGTFEKK